MSDNKSGARRLRALHLPHDEDPEIALCGSQSRLLTDRANVTCEVCVDMITSRRKFEDETTDTEDALEGMLAVLRAFESEADLHELEELIWYLGDSSDDRAAKVAVLRRMVFDDFPAHKAIAIMRRMNMGYPTEEE